MPSLPKTLSVGAVAVLAAIATGVGISQATADPSSTSTPRSSSSGSSGSGGSSSGAASANSGTTGTMPGRGFGRHGYGPRGMGPRGMGWGMDASALATKLGVDEATLTAALPKVRMSMHDADDEATKDRTGPPTEAGRAARQQEFAAALAEELGIDQAKVTAALDALRAERQADARAAFSARLDEAVKAGTLTEADKASILKAFDAGVLGGGFGRH